MMYTKKVIETFKNPHNVGEMKDPDGYGKVGNASCGDVMEMFLRVKEGKIEDIKFKTFGCAAAISTSSIMTDLAKGKTLEEAEKISKADIAGELGGLPPVKMHCSVLATEALEAAIKDYREKSKTAK